MTNEEKVEALRRALCHWKASGKTPEDVARIMVAGYNAMKTGNGLTYSEFYNEVLSILQGEMEKL